MTVNQCENEYSDDKKENEWNNAKNEQENDAYGKEDVFILRPAYGRGRSRGSAK